MRGGILLSLFLLPLLSGCENTVGAYAIDGRNHSITLVREQSFPFSSQVEQSIIAARFPQCQRRYSIGPGKPGRAKIELWQLQDRLFVARDGKAWYAISTDQCQVQKIEPTGDQPPGTLLGTFRMRNNALVFEKQKEEQGTQ
ncbi:MAG: hypothetical protein FWD62_04770 [Betaproteobacteria bacterium]|nr:hypothetical protein [Betaproteobacteria bacterium]